MEKRILITGGAGFIGSHLCEKLFNEDNEVICADNFFTGSKRSITRIINESSKETIDYFERLLSNER